ncbi:hypothetical protein E2I00_002480, partial [Balaenoptera physalus]
SGNNGPAVLGGAKGGPSDPSSLSPLGGQTLAWLDVSTMDRDLSDDDSVMDLSFEAESPLAPPAELLERLPSCDWLLQGDRCQIFFPPSEAPGRPQEQRCWSSFLEHRVPVVTEEVAREALLSFVDSKCCYGSAAAGDLVILELKQQALRRYRLETFSESRISEWTFQPFTNHSVDGPQRGTSPRLWDIKVQVPPMFQEDTRKFQVPHSSLVKIKESVHSQECHKCHGHGRYKCSSCHGAGTMQHMLREGEQDLCHLQGREETAALPPAGHRVNSLFEFVSEHQLDCPGELLAKARGETLFKDENTMRQTIELIPLTEVRYWYQGKTYVYYIYGTDHKVYVVDYPERGRFLAVAIIGGRSPGKRGIQQCSGTSAQWSGIPRVTWLADTPLTRRTYFYKAQMQLKSLEGREQNARAAVTPKLATAHGGSGPDSILL